MVKIKEREMPWELEEFVNGFLDDVPLSEEDEKRLERFALACYFLGMRLNGGTL